MSPRTPKWIGSTCSWASSARVFAFVIVGVFVLKRLPWLIAAFRIAIANDDAKAKRARKVLEAIEPCWHWIWQKRGAAPAAPGP